MLKKIEKLASDFDNDLDQISREIKRVQSIKCRLKKQKFKKSYDQEMTKVLKYEQALKEAKNLLSPRKKFTTEYTENDVEKLSYDETIKALRSIQSKKSLTKYTSEEPGTSEEYVKATEIEKMLLKHKASTEPVDKVSKLDIVKVIEEAKNNKITKARIITLLEQLIEE